MATEEQAQVVGQEENRNLEASNPDKKKVKKQIERFTYKPDQLIDNPKGLAHLYKKIEAKLVFNPNEQLNELKQFKKIMELYKEWHFQFVPKYDFKHFLDRTKDFGKSPIIQTYMQKLRKVYQGQLSLEELQGSTALAGKDVESKADANQNTAHTDYDPDLDLRKQLKIKHQPQPPITKKPIQHEIDFEPPVIAAEFDYVEQQEDIEEVDDFDEEELKLLNNKIKKAVVSQPLTVNQVVQPKNSIISHQSTQINPSFQADTNNKYATELNRNAYQNSWQQEHSIKLQKRSDSLSEEYQMNPQSSGIQGEEELEELDLAKQLKKKKN